MARAPCNSAPSRPTGEQLQLVAGAPYAKIMSGADAGEYLNQAAGNPRQGEAFRLEHRSGLTLHVYGSGTDEVVEVVRPKTPAVTSAPTSTSGTTTPSSGAANATSGATTPASGATTTPGTTTMPATGTGSEASPTGAGGSSPTDTDTDSGTDTDASSGTAGAPGGTAGAPGSS